MPAVRVKNNFEEKSAPAHKPVFGLQDIKNGGFAARGAGV